MKKLAVVLTGIAILLAVVIASASVGGSTASVPTSNINWTPVIAVQLAVATLIDKDAPLPPDDTPRPHPDVDKCACKGTGVIRHGDGHETPCPYHSNGMDERKWKCKCDKSGYYCACIATYGKCDCTKVNAVSGGPGTSSLSLLFANLFGGRRR